MRMRVRSLLPLILILAIPVILVLAATFTVTVKYGLEPSCYWSASRTPTTYSKYDLSGSSAYSLTTYPWCIPLYSVSPTSVWGASSFPRRVSSYVLSPSSAWGTRLTFSINTFRGGVLNIDQLSGESVSLDKIFWDGGVWVNAPTAATLLFKTDRPLYVSQGSSTRSSDGQVVSIPAGKTLVAEKATMSVIDLVDPLGMRRFGVTLVMENSVTGKTVVEPYVLCEVPLHTSLSFSMINGKLGSVYLNGTKISLPIYLGNATHYRFTIVVKGRVVIPNSTIEFTGSRDYLRMVVSGIVVDSTYGTPVSNAVVKAFIEGSYAGYAISLGDGSFVIDNFVKTPSKRSVKVTLKVEHDDYEEYTLVKTATVPAVAPALELPSEYAIPTVAITALLVIGVVTTLAYRKPWKLKTRKKEFISQKPS